MRQLQVREKATLQLSIYHKVDATRIRETLEPQIEDYSSSFSPDEVTFCHPHIGSEDLRRNSALVAHFFASAKTSFTVPAKLLQVTLLASQYDRWQVCKIEGLNNLRLLGTYTMDPALFTHGYETRRH